MSSTVMSSYAENSQPDGMPLISVESSVAVPSEARLILRELEERIGIIDVRKSVCQGKYRRKYRRELSSEKFRVFLMRSLIFGDDLDVLVVDDDNAREMNDPGLLQSCLDGG